MAEIRITQYLRPSGKKDELLADIPDELKGKADLLAVSCETVPPNHVMIYAHVKGQSEEDELSELAENGPGENSPTEALIRLIKRF